MIGHSAWMAKMLASIPKSGQLQSKAFNLKRKWTLIARGTSKREKKQEKLHSFQGKLFYQPSHGALVLAGRSLCGSIQARHHMVRAVTVRKWPRDLGKLPGHLIHSTSDPLWRHLGSSLPALTLEKPICTTRAPGPQRAPGVSGQALNILISGFVFRTS